MDRKVTGKAIVKVGNWTEKLSAPAAEEPPVTKAESPVGITKPWVIQFKDIKKYIGKSLPVSDWFAVTQEMINDFAKATHDYQWIHVDVDKAKEYMPEGKTIAHGYLTLSLASKFFFELLAIEGVTTSINYGLNKARFPVAVKSGSQIRMSGRIMNVEDMPQGGGVKLFLECKIEVQGEEKPAYVGELITALF